MASLVQVPATEDGVSLQTGEGEKAGGGGGGGETECAGCASRRMLSAVPTSPLLRLKASSTTERCGVDAPRRLEIVETPERISACIRAEHGWRQVR